MTTLSAKTDHCRKCAYRTLEGLLLTNQHLIEMFGSSCIHATYRAPQIVAFECKVCGTRVDPFTIRQHPRALCSCGCSYHHQFRKVFK